MKTRLTKANSISLRILLSFLTSAFLLTVPLSSEADNVRGKVIAVKGQLVTIRLANAGDASRVTSGDRVSLSFSTADGDVIPVGTWQISVVKSDGMIEATPVDAEVPPSPSLDAVIHTSPDTGESAEMAHPHRVVTESPMEQLPEILGRSDATRDLSSLGDTIACATGNVKVALDQVQMISAYKKKNAGKYCHFRISESGLTDFHASVRIEADSQNFLIGLFFGVLDPVEANAGSILMLGEAAPGSVLATVGLMTTTSTSGGRNKSKDVISTSWISANSVNGAGETELKLQREELETALSTHNPLPGTLELIRLGTHYRLLWQGELKATWSEQSVPAGEIRIVFAQVSGKGAATFNDIRIDRLETPANF